MAIPSKRVDELDADNALDGDEYVLIQDPVTKTYYRTTATQIAESGSGGGAVDSVNAQTGVVVLDADDIDDTATINKFVTSADVTKLSNLSGTNTGDQDLSTYQVKPAEGAFANGDKTKLDGIESGATADQSASEILTAIKTVDGTGSGLDADTLDGSHATAFATSAQGALADSAVQPGALATVATTGAYADLSGSPTIPTSVDNLGPTQTGNSGKYLTTDGTNASWATVASGGAWGTITGTLSSQTDLQTALDAKAVDADVVHDTGNETVAGIKTFSSSPIVPTATLSTQAVNKEQVEAYIATNSGDIKSSDTAFGTVKLDVPADNIVEPKAYSATADRVSALGGGGDFGTPSTTNKFLTESFLSTRQVIQTFSASGTWTKPTGAKAVFVQLWAGGGSGGKGTTSGAGGGGGGGYAEAFLAGSILGSTVSVTVGLGGASVSSANTVGFAGGSSSFGTFKIVYGGGRGGLGDGAGGGSVFAVGGNGSSNDGGNGGGYYYLGTTPAPGKGGDTDTPINGASGIPFPDVGGGGGCSSFSSETPHGGSSYNGGGGGGGGGGDASVGAAGSGGSSYNGGGGGGGVGTYAGEGSGGGSTIGGAGGAGVLGGAGGIAGSVPGGGGGATYNGTASGAGGNGRVVVMTFF